jgi:hypothetical protein
LPDRFFAQRPLISERLLDRLSLIGPFIPITANFSIRFYEFADRLFHSGRKKK